MDKNPHEAVRWWKKAAELGFPESQNNLGALYNDGNGVDRDYQEAVFWYRKSACRATNWDSTILGWLIITAEG